VLCTGWSLIEGEVAVQVHAHGVFVGTDSVGRVAVLAPVVHMILSVAAAVGVGQRQEHEVDLVQQVADLRVAVLKAGVAVGKPFALAV
jgi:hypothetical protein